MVPPQKTQKCLSTASDCSVPPSTASILFSTASVLRVCRSARLGWCSSIANGTGTSSYNGRTVPGTSVTHTHAYLPRASFLHLATSRAKKKRSKPRKAKKKKRKKSQPHNLIRLNTSKAQTSQRSFITLKKGQNLRWSKVKRSKRSKVKPGGHRPRGGPSASPPPPRGSAARYPAARDPSRT
eukprot:3528510-Rhodomonas_salina.1